MSRVSTNENAVYISPEIGKYFENNFVISGHGSKVRFPSAQRPLLLLVRLGSAALQERRQVRVEDPGHPRGEDHPQHHQPRHPSQRQLSAGLSRGSQQFW